jgi:hypothetical protein
MRTSVVAAVAGVLVLAAGAGYYGHEVYLQQRFRTGLDQTLAALPPHTIATYKDAHYSVLSHHAVVTGLTLHAEIAGQTPQQIDITIDSIETENPNLDLPSSWNKAVADKAAFTSEMALPVADSITVNGVTVHSAAITMTEDSFRIDKLRVYPWAFLHDGMPALEEIRTSLAPRSQPPTLADLQPLLRAEAAVMLGIAYDAYHAGTMKVAATLPAIEIAYAVNHMTGDGFDRGVMKGGSAEGITGNSTKSGTFSVDRIAMGASDFREPMTRIVNGEALSPALLNGVRIGRIEYGGITVQPPGQPPFHVGSLSIGPVAFAQGMPVSATLAWQDISVSRSQLPDGKARDAFTKLGLETTTTSFALSYDWDVAQQRASLHDTMLKVNELGAITVSADLTNVVANVASLNQTQLAHARLRFEDASLVDRLLRAGAAQAGVDPTAYRQQIAGMMRQPSGKAGENSPLLAAVGQTLGDFITSPHSLTVELSPPAPVSFISLQRAATVPATLADMLGLAVSANQP